VYSTVRSVLYAVRSHHRWSPRGHGLDLEDPRGQLTMSLVLGFNFQVLGLGSGLPVPGLGLGLSVIGLRLGFQVLGLGLGYQSLVLTSDCQSLALASISVLGLGISP